MRKVIGIGETILDIIFKDNTPVKAVPGGSAFNTMISLGRLNVANCFISEIGNDQVGTIILDFMKSNNLTTDYVNQYWDGKSALALAFLDEDKNADYSFYTNYPKQRLDIVWPTVNADDIVVFGSYFALNPVLHSRVIEFLEYAQSRKAIIYYDVNFRKAHIHELMKIMPALMDNLEFADIVRASDEDCLNLYKMTDAKEIFKHKIKFYSKNFIFTQGPKDVVLHTNTEESYFPVTPINTVSSIGAGDSFNAGVIFGLLKYDISRNELNDLDIRRWAKIIQYGMDFSSEVCKQYDNYISNDFAALYR